MNRYFDFTSRQIRFVAVLCLTAAVMGGYLVIRSYAYPESSVPPMEIIVGENEKLFEGVFVLDPNTAPVDSLELLPGIGPALADRIVMFRMDNVFKSPIDLIEVKGIGPRTFERLRPYIRIVGDR